MANIDVSAPSTNGPALQDAFEAVLNNAKALQTNTIRQALTQAIENSGARSIFAFVGDSTTAPYASHVTRNMAALVRAGVPCRNDFFAPGITGDSRIVLNSGWSTQNYNGAVYENTTNTATMVLSPTKSFNKVRVWYYDDNAGSISVQPGSDTATTITVSNAGTLKSVLVTAVSTAIQTITVSRTSGTGRIVAFDCYDSATFDIQFCNMGLGGQTSDFAIGTTAYGVGPLCTAMGATAVFYALGLNDFALNSTVGTYTTNITNFNTRMTSLGANLVFIAQHPGSASPAGGLLQSAFIAALKTFAQANSRQVVDMFNRWGASWTLSNAAGWMSGDTLHPNFLGQDDWGRTEAKLILNA